MEHYRVKQTTCGNCLGRIFTLDETHSELHFVTADKCDKIIKYTKINKHDTTIRINNNDCFIIGQLIK